MKSWADTCSSDEESDDDGLHPARAAGPKAIHPSLVEEESSEDDDEGDYNHQRNGNVNAEGEEFDKDYPPMPQQRDYSNMQLPSTPPFTAHLGNLSYDVQNSNQLSQEIERLVDFRYRGTEKVAVTSARVGTDRETGKMKGYGYIEFATLEELCLVLNLNDGHSQIRGRNLRIDVAQPRRQNDRNLRRSSSHQSHSSLPEIDGTQFRGGRYANRSNSNLNTHSNLNSSSSGNLRRNASVSSVGSNASDSGPVADASASASGGMQRQRSALRLAPRTKPVGDVSSGKRGSSSDIFGGAKPRDETSWESKRSSSSLAVEDVGVNAGAGGEKKEDGDTGEKDVTEKSSGTANGDKKVDGGGTRNNANGTTNRRDSQRQERTRGGGGRGNDRRNSAGKLGGSDGKRPNGNGNRRNSALSTSSSDTHSKKVGGGGGGRGTVGNGNGGGNHKRGSVASRGGNKGGERGKDDSSGANSTAGGGGNARKGSSGVSSKAMPVPPVAAKETKAAAPVNKFALLGFDSDSD